YQICILGSLLAYGTLTLHFEVSLLQASVTLASVIAFQALFTYGVRIPHYEFKSALISGLSLCLLLRANSLSLLILASGLAIASKFLLRCNGKHVFNPTNFGIGATVLFTGQAWVSPGQWGSGVLFALFILCCGWTVVQRAERSDVTLTFLLAYPGLFFARALWLGDPWTIPLHQLSNGALLIFTFFMISDPKTTPDSRTGRILFAIMVACLAYLLRFKLYHPNALIFSLLACSVFVPILDRYFAGIQFNWVGNGHKPENSFGHRFPIAMMIDQTEKPIP
ncbi:MAG: RnfABCDGE type electron transport complex subunit D, partial [Candidatus Methylumidiphilus sp.]